MTDKATATATEIPEIDKFASKILGIGGMAVGGFAAWSMGNSAGALIFGYATYGAAIPLAGYAGLLAGAAALVKYHGQKLGWDKIPGEGGISPEATAPVPTATALRASVNEAEEAVNRLNARADELGQHLDLDNSRPKHGV